MKRSAFSAGRTLAISICCAAPLPQAGASCESSLFAQTAAALLNTDEQSADERFNTQRPGCHADAGSAACDWITTIEHDTRIGSDRRLVLTASSHQSGSGTWGSVQVYGCVGGRVQVLLNLRKLYGVTVEEVTPTRLVIRYGQWATNDPRCCPSNTVRDVLVWDAVAQRYVGPDSAQ